jgi:integrase
MGKYLTTAYPGIFKYEGKEKTTYGISYRVNGKFYREIICPLLGEAKEKLAEKKGLAKQGIRIDKKVTFREFAQKYADLQTGQPSYEKSGKYFIGYWEKNEQIDPQKKERKWHDMILTEHFGDQKLYQITPLDIETFKKERSETPARGKKTRSVVSVNRELETLRHILNKAKEWRMIDHNPFDRFKRSDGKSSLFYKEDNGWIRYLKEDEIKKLLSFSPPHLKNIIKGALLTGLRKGDLFNMRWSNVDLEQGILFYKEEKSENEKIKRLSSDMIDLLMKIPKRESDHIFTGPDGKPLKDVQRSFRTALRKARIKNFRFHDHRHTSASHLAMRGVSMKAIQEHLGHSSITMTQRYSHLSPEFQKSEIEKLSGLCDEDPGDKKLIRNDQIPRSEQKPELDATA